MFYYKYDPNSYMILSKYSEETKGENIASCDQDFDLLLCDVVIGFLSNDGEILRYTKKIKSVEIIESLLNDIKSKQIESEIDIDYRLSLIELGLA